MAGEHDGIDDLLLEGLNSGPGTPLIPGDWERIRREGKALIARNRESIPQPPPGYKVALEDGAKNRQVGFEDE